MDFQNLTALCLPEMIACVLGEIRGHDIIEYNESRLIKPTFLML
jgi:hypothetical protein